MSEKRCNCDDLCWACDKGYDGEECSCFDPCPVHQPVSYEQGLSTFCDAAQAELMASDSPRAARLRGRIADRSSSDPATSKDPKP